MYLKTWQVVDIILIMIIGCKKSGKIFQNTVENFFLSVCYGFFKEYFKQYILKQVLKVSYLLFLDFFFSFKGS